MLLWVWLYWSYPFGTSGLIRVSNRLWRWGRGSSMSSQAGRSNFSRLKPLRSCLSYPKYPLCNRCTGRGLCLSQVKTTESPIAPRMETNDRTAVGDPQRTLMLWIWLVTDVYCVVDRLLSQATNNHSLTQLVNIFNSMPQVTEFSKPQR